MRKSKQCWSRSFGTYGAVVRLSELKQGGNLYLIWLDAHGKQQKRSLGHRDRKLGIKQAQEASLAIGADRNALTTGNMTLGRVADSYLTNGLHDRSAQYVADTTRSLRLVCGFLGFERLVESLSFSDVQRFVQARKLGQVRSGDRQLSTPGSETTIWHDFGALKRALNWATKHRGANGRTLIAVNPLRDFSIPKNPTPNRPHAPVEYYHSLRTAAAQVSDKLGLLLDLAFETGRRRNAILHLRWEVIEFGRSDDFPYGSIRWEKRFDKMRMDRTIPMNASARESLLHAHREAGEPTAGWVFPSALSEDGAVSPDQAKRWFCRAERLAGVSHVKGRGWHSFRRAWASARKHYPVPDLMVARGWSDKESLLNCYVEADPETVFRVVSEPAYAKKLARPIQQPIHSPESDSAHSSANAHSNEGCALGVKVGIDRKT